MFVLNYFFVTHLEAVLDVEISWKFEASTMKNRGENEKWKIVEKKKKKTRLDQSNVLDWQVSSILLKT